LDFRLSYDYGNTVIKVTDGYRSVIVDKNGHVNITYDNPDSADLQSVLFTIKKRVIGLEL